VVVRQQAGNAVAGGALELGDSAWLLGGIHIISIRLLDDRQGQDIFDKDTQQLVGFTTRNLLDKVMRKFRVSFNKRGIGQGSLIRQ
jgi:hypothetical protein